VQFGTTDPTTCLWRSVEWRPYDKKARLVDAYLRRNTYKNALN